MNLSYEKFSLIPGFEFFSNDECKKCNDVCTDKYVPVCGYSKSLNESVTFSNDCKLSIEQCKNPQYGYDKFSDGICLEDQCNNICTKELKLVCAYSSALDTYLEFPNECKLKYYICSNIDDGYSKYGDGECPKTCSAACTDIDDPVCAYSTTLERYLDFYNECQLNNYACNNPDEGYAKYSDGICPKECGKSCSKLFQPICAYSSKLDKYLDFSNDCELKNYVCKNPDDGYFKFSDGKCPKKCNEVCSKIYHLVCAYSSKLDKYLNFSNDCLLESYACKHPNEG